jgi:hypothetical protein
VSGFLVGVVVGLLLGVLIGVLLMAALSARRDDVTPTPTLPRERGRENEPGTQDTRPDP